MGGGILPYTIHEGEIYFLLSRESIDYKWKESGLWSDFGGKKEKNETYKDAAIREGYEESNGILGDEKYIENLIDNHCIFHLTKNKHRVYVVYIKYDKHIPRKYRRKYLKARNYNPEEFKQNRHFYEKDMLRWMSIKDIYSNMNMFRYYYKYVIKNIISRMKTYAIEDITLN